MVILVIIELLYYGEKFLTEQNGITAQIHHFKI